jgi:hypothetical protein
MWLPWMGGSVDAMHVAWQQQQQQQPQRKANA